MKIYFFFIFLILSEAIKTRDRDKKNKKDITGVPVRKVNPGDIEPVPVRKSYTPSKSYKKDDTKDETPTQD